MKWTSYKTRFKDQIDILRMKEKMIKEHGKDVKSKDVEKLKSKNLNSYI